MIDHNLLEQISKKFIMLSKLSISDMEKDIVKCIAREELKEFDTSDIMEVFFLNKYRYAFPSLFLALNEFWTELDFQGWLGIIQELDNYLDGIVSWIFYSGQCMGIDGLEAALDSDLLSPKTKTLLKKRLQKGTPQPLGRHLEELAAWGIDFNTVHQKMVQSGGPCIPANHDYYS